MCFVKVMPGSPEGPFPFGLEISTGHLWELTTVLSHVFRTKKKLRSLALNLGQSWFKHFWESNTAWFTTKHDRNTTASPAASPGEPVDAAWSNQGAGCVSNLPKNASFFATRWPPLNCESYSNRIAIHIWLYERSANGMGGNSCWVAHSVFHICSVHELLHISSQTSFAASYLRDKMPWVDAKAHQFRT